MKEQIIASTAMADIQKELLTKPKAFTLNDALKLERTHEALTTHLKQLHTMSDFADKAANNANIPIIGPRLSKYKNWGTSPSSSR